MFILLSSYECNLRAYLMSVDFERPVDTDQDMLDQKVKFYLPLGTPFLHTYLTSPIRAQREVGKQVNNSLEALSVNKILNGFMCRLRSTTGSYRTSRGFQPRSWCRKSLTMVKHNMNLQFIE